MFSMFGAKRAVAEVPQETRLSPLDRLVVEKTGHMTKPSPFEFIVRQAALESALSNDPSWPPSNVTNAIHMYNAYKEKYEAGELDDVVAKLDLNDVILKAGSLATASVGGVLPARKNW